MTLRRNAVELRVKSTGYRVRNEYREYIDYKSGRVQEKM